MQPYIENLKITDVAVQGKKINDDLMRTWQGDMFSPESCANQSFITLQTFNPLPPRLQHLETRMYEGLDAYLFLLRLYVGLESIRQGEKHVVSQVRGRWLEFCHDYPDSAQEIAPVMQNIFGDGKIIRRLYTEQIVTNNYGIAARQVSSLNGKKARKCSAVIFVGNTNKLIDLIRAVGEKKPTVDKIILTHPDKKKLFDPDFLESLYAKLYKHDENMKFSGLVSSIVLKSLEDCAKQRFLGAHNFFVCTNPKDGYDPEIAASISNLENDCNQVVHLALGDQPDYWQAKNIDYHSSQDIAAVFTDRQSHNHMLLRKAALACDCAVKERANGRVNQPNEFMLSQNVEREFSELQKINKSHSRKADKKIASAQALIP